MVKRRLTEEYKAIEDHAAGIAGEEDTDCSVEPSKLWGIDGVSWDVQSRHGRWWRERGLCGYEGDPGGQRGCVNNRQHGADPTGGDP